MSKELISIQSNKQVFYDRNTDTAYLTLNVNTFNEQNDVLPNVQFAVYLNNEQQAIFQTDPFGCYSDVLAIDAATIPIRKVSHIRLCTSGGGICGVNFGLFPFFTRCNGRTRPGSLLFDVLAPAGLLPSQTTNFYFLSVPWEPYVNLPIKLYASESDTSEKPGVFISESSLQKLPDEPHPFFEFTNFRHNPAEYRTFVLECHGRHWSIVHPSLFQYRDPTSLPRFEIPDIRELKLSDDFAMPESVRRKLDKSKYRSDSNPFSNLEKTLLLYYEDVKAILEDLYKRRLRITLDMETISGSSTEENIVHESLANDLRDLDNEILQRLQLRDQLENHIKNLT